MSDTCGFNNVFIPLNIRNSSSLPEIGFNEFGYPLCPNNPDLIMKYGGNTNEKGRSNRIKWNCPKVHIVRGHGYATAAILVLMLN